MSQTTLNPPIPREPKRSTTTEDDGGIALMNLLHALRRRWLLILIAGVPLAIATMAVLWVVIPERYEAVAELLVRSQEDRLLPALDPRNRGQYVASDYDIFRQTQASLITSAFVLNAVMREPEIQSLAMLDPDTVPNPIGYLQDNLQATYPNDAEVLRISMHGDRPDELKRLVDAVTDAYLEETVFNREKRLQDRMGKLDQEYRDNRDKIRDKRESIHSQEVQLGARDASNSHIRHQLELEKLRKLDESRSTVESRMYEIDLRLTLASAIEQNFGEVELPEYLITEELERDEKYNQLLNDLNLAQQYYTSIASTARSSAPSVQLAASQTDVLAGQLAARRRQLSRRIEQKIFSESTNTSDNEASLALLQAERVLLAKRQADVEKLHEDQLAYVRQLDGFSARLETEREELAYAVKLNQARHAEIEDLRVQLDSPDRIWKIQSATIPNANSRQMKLIQVICAAFIVVGMVAAGAVGWDMTRKIAGDGFQAALASGVSMVGRLPRLQAGAFWFGGSKSAMESSLIEAIDGIRAAVLRPSVETNGAQIVMVTSSVGGEGRTTLATYLAAACARSGKRVLLIDADMRNPQQHVVFDRDGERGLCDVLRGTSATESFIVSTTYDGLDLLPTGRSDAASRRILTGEQLPRHLDELGQGYDYVVIDTGPVITSVEPLAVGRCADVVLLSAMRDLTRATELTDACGRLEASGIEPRGIVFQGGRLLHRRLANRND